MLSSAIASQRLLTCPALFFPSLSSLPAVITGVQVHNWAYDFEDDSPNLEFVAPTSAYVVVNGVKTHVDLAAMPPLTPRQIRLLHGGDQSVVCNTGGQSTLRAEDPPFAYDNKETRKVQKQRLQR